MNRRRLRSVRRAGVREDVRVSEGGAEVQHVCDVTLIDAQVPHAAAERLSAAQTVLLHIRCENRETPDQIHHNIRNGDYRIQFSAGNSN